MISWSDVSLQSCRELQREKKEVHRRFYHARDTENITQGKSISFLYLFFSTTADQNASSSTMFKVQTKIWLRICGKTWKLQLNPLNQTEQMCINWTELSVSRYPRTQEKVSIQGSECRHRTICKVVFAKKIFKKSCIIFLPPLNDMLLIWHTQSQKIHI